MRLALLLALAVAACAAGAAEPADEPRRRGHLERGRAPASAASPASRSLPTAAASAPISDRGAWATGSLERDADGRIADVDLDGIGPLHAIDGQPLEGERGRRRGAGARRATAAPTSPSSISTASAATTTSTARPRAVRPHPDFAGLQRNSGLEALAIDADGTLYAIPERSGKLEPAVPGLPPARRPLGQGAQAPPRRRLPRRRRHLRPGRPALPARARLRMARRLPHPGPPLRARPRRLRRTRRRCSRPASASSTTWKASPSGRTREAAPASLLLSDDNFFPLQRTMFAEYIVAD